MFDFHAFYDAIAELLPDNSVIAEVGLADGASAVYLAEALLNKGKVFKFHWIDNLAYGGADQLSTLIKHLTAAKLGRYVEILPYDSLNASCRFPDCHFDFVFIDASHRFEYTKADARLWYRKIKMGGILAGHDFNEQEGVEVHSAIKLVVPTDRLVWHTTENCWGVWSVKRLLENDQIN